MSEALTLHASCIAVGGTGVLLLGAPGAGKSDLVLRMIDAPGYGLGTEFLRSQLVADDQVELTRLGDVLTASPPAALRGLLELRGHGILRLPFAERAVLGLAVSLSPGEPAARLPDPGIGWTALGVTLPLLTLDPALASAPARIRAALLARPGSVAPPAP